MVENVKIRFRAMNMTGGERRMVALYADDSAVWATASTRGTTSRVVGPGLLRKPLATDAAAIRNLAAFLTELHGPSGWVEG